MRSQTLSTAAKRQLWLQSLVCDDGPDSPVCPEDAKLCLALQWQRAGHEGRAEAYAGVLGQLARGAFVGDEAAFGSAMERALPMVASGGPFEVAAACAAVGSPWQVPLTPAQRNAVLAAVVLKHMEFVEKGL
jgi:hypothetical protein